MKKLNQMKRYALYGLWLGAAALLAAAGVVSLLGAHTPGTAAGVMILLSGLMQAALSRLMRRNAFGDRSFFTKGVTSMAVGALTLCGAFISGEVLRALVSMMTLMAGVNLLTAALAMQADRIAGRWLLAGLALVEMLLGAAGFLKPELLGVMAGPITGVSLLYEGGVILLTWHTAMKWLNKTQLTA